MAALRPKELLELLLEGNPLTPDELEQFIREHRDEDQYFDCKDGAITTPTRRKEGSQIIRKWMSGFANSDGGILIVGVNEPNDKNEPRKIAPCEARIGEQTPEEWATRCLLAMAGSFSPPPRFQTIQHPQGPVLTIAVARAPALVPCVDAGELKYFLRIHDSTVEAPAYLITDLVLGRRQHPILDLHPPTTEVRTHVLPVGSAADRISVQRVSFRFSVENLSLATADEVRIGVISWSLMEGSTREGLNRHLRLHLEIADLESADISIQDVVRSESCVIHRSSPPSGGGTMPLAPFQIGPESSRIGPFYFPCEIPLKVSCAVYVLSKSAPLTWFQLEFRSTHEGIAGVAIIRKGSERPKVAWEADPI
jgi:hypothetical protein